jgi:hypothetical protein
MGRSRGRLTSKIHAHVDSNGLPVRLARTPGEAHGSFSSLNRDRRFDNLRECLGVTASLALRRPARSVRLAEGRTSTPALTIQASLHK